MTRFTKDARVVGSGDCPRNGVSGFIARQGRRSHHDRDNHQQQFVGGGVGQTGAVAPTPPPPVGLAELGKAQREVIAQMVPQAKDAGIALTGPDGPLKALTAQVVGAALDGELNEHLGYDEHGPVGRRRGDSRNGTRSRTVVTGNVGVIQIEVPRDRDGIFESQLTKKRQRRLPEVDQMVLSLFAKGVDDR